MLIDTGTAEAADRVIAEIKKLTDSPIRYIINTTETQTTWVVMTRFPRRVCRFTRLAR